jgi:uncharacterized protein YybS (DUF2232 family)
MFALARLAMRSRGHAAVAAGALAGVAFAIFASAQLLLLVFIPVALLLYASGALVGLATLRNGHHEGLMVASGAAVMLAAGIVLTGGRWLHMLEALLSVWLPALVSCAVLAKTAAQGRALEALAILAGLGWTLAFALNGDLAVTLEPWVRDAWEQLEAAMRQSGSGADVRMAPVVPLELARVFVQLLMSWWVLGAVLTLMLARSWHSRMDRPGAFGDEFRALRLPRSLAWALPLALIVGTVASDGLKTYAGGLAQLGLLLFAVQGVALAHALVKMRNGHSAWLTAVYIVPFVIPMAILAIAFVGYLDHWFDYRKRAMKTRE